MSDDERPWLAGDLVKRLDPMLNMLVSEPFSLSSVRNPDEARRVHVADSLSGLAVSELSESTNVADIGSGAGFPGIPLAMALPNTKFTLIDSVGKKVRFIQSVIDELGLENAEGLNSRSEDWASAGGAAAYDVVTARAVAPLEALAELASPLLREGGSLVAWKGDREIEEEQKLAALEDRLAMKIDRVVPVRPYSSSRERNIYVVKKMGPTPPGLPRRAGMVRKRPLSA